MKITVKEKALILKRRQVVADDDPKTLGEWCKLNKNKYVELGGSSNTTSGIGTFTVKGFLNFNSSVIHIYDSKTRTGINIEKYDKLNISKIDKYNVNFDLPENKIKAVLTLLKKD